MLSPNRDKIDEPQRTPVVAAGWGGVSNEDGLFPRSPADRAGSSSHGG